jgi:transcriptional regulator with XRE-family HTH domain
MENLQKFSSRVKKRRKELRLTLQEVADAVGLSVSAVSAWESGKNFPERDKEEALARVLETDKRWLLEDEPDETRLSEEAMQSLRVTSRMAKKTPSEFLIYLVDTYGADAIKDLTGGG